MKRSLPLFWILLILALALQACNMPGGSTPPTAVPGTDEPVKVEINQALTIAAQTIAAAASPVPSATETATVGPPTDTPVVGVTVTVSSDTNCRTGPSTDYDIVMLFRPGMSAKVVGKYGASHWIIEYPGGFGSTCWLWGAYATVIGNTALLQEGVPPPLPPTKTPMPTDTVAPMAPAPPKGVHTSCTSENVSEKVGDLWIIRFKWTVKILWKDQSDNEDGFSIYKGGSLLATVGPNQTSYTDVFTRLLMLEPVTYVYGVQSFNDHGTSVIKDVSIGTCP